MKYKRNILLIAIIFFSNINNAFGYENNLLDKFNNYNQKNNYSEVFLDFAEIYIKLKQFDQAKQELNKVFAYDPNNVKTNYLLGSINLKQKKYSIAKEYFLKVNKIDNKHILSKLDLANIYLKEGNIKKSLKTTQEVLEISPENYEANQIFFNLNKVCSENEKNKLKITVKINTQKTYICKGKKIIKVMKSSTGTLNKPTPLGSFKVQNRAKWFFSKKYQQGGKYFVSFRDWGIYGFHSIPMDKNKNVLNEEAIKLGKRASHGCVRLEIKDSKWIYDNIKQGTKVQIVF